MASQRAKKRRSWLSQFEHSGRRDGHECNVRQIALANMNHPSLNCRTRSLQCAIETFATRSQRAQSEAAAWQLPPPPATHSTTTFVQPCQPACLQCSREWKKSLLKECTKIQRRQHRPVNPRCVCVREVHWRGVQPRVCLATFCVGVGVTLLRSLFKNPNRNPE